MRARRIPILVAAVGLTVAACGTSDSASSPATGVRPEPVATAPTDAPSEASGTVDTQAPTVAPVVTDAPAPTVAPVEPTAAPPSEPEPVPVGGRAFATAVEADARFDRNPFPDLVVHDVGRGGEANIANILPSERPVLLWAWAPH